MSTSAPPKLVAFARAIADHPEMDPENGDGAALARLAGYAPGSARQMACKNLRDPRCAQLVEQFRSERPANPVASDRMIEATQPEGPLDIDKIRRRVVSRMLELFEQDGNPNVAFKAGEWLGRYTRVIEIERARAETEKDTVGDEGMDLETARKVREAARMAA